MNIYLIKTKTFDGSPLSPILMLGRSLSFIWFSPGVWCGNAAFRRKDARKSRVFYLAEFWKGFALVNFRTPWEKTVVSVNMAKVGMSYYFGYDYLTEEVERCVRANLLRELLQFNWRKLKWETVNPNELLADRNPSDPTI